MANEGLEYQVHGDRNSPGFWVELAKWMNVALKRGKRALELPAVENLLINGEFDIWQRGTSFTVAGYTADRWKVAGNASSFAVSRSTYNDSIGQYGLLMTLNTKGASFTYLSAIHVLESRDCYYLRGKTLTFSARIRRSVFTEGSIRMSIYTATGIDEAFLTTGRVATTVDIPATDLNNSTWVEKYVTATVPDNASQVCVLIWFFDNATPDGAAISIRDARLTISGGPVECHKRSFGEELALCQRYYEKSYDVDVTPGTSTGIGHFALHGCVQGVGIIAAMVQFKVSKRIQLYTPSFYTTTGGLNTWNFQMNGSNGTVSPYLSAGAQGKTGMQIYGSIGGVWVPATFWGHWAVDAEL